jgi:hypothetical protein
MGNKLVEIYKVIKQFNEKTLVDSFVMPINGEEDRLKAFNKVPWNTCTTDKEYDDFIEGTVDSLKGDFLDLSGFGFEIIIQKPEVEVLPNYGLYEPEELDESDELVTVPKFVDRWIKCTQQDEREYDSDEDAKADSIHFAIFGLFANYPNTNPDVHIRKPVLEWLNNRENYSVLFKALMFGYNLEETKYYAKIKGWDNTIAKRVFWCHNGISSEPGLTDETYAFTSDIFKTMEDWEKIGINEDNADFMEEK